LLCWVVLKPKKPITQLRQVVIKHWGKATCFGFFPP
jgi:hypothetical protein